MTSRLNTEYRALNLFAVACGLALWLPAVGVPVWQVRLQPMDLLALVALPLIVVFRKYLAPEIFIGVTLLIAAFSMSTWVGGSVTVLLYYLGFILPFILGLYIILRVRAAQRWFLSAFLLGGVLSCLFFLTQIVFGAENLDFRNNSFFRMPPHFGRGFALFPEVSTFAAHAVIVLGVLLSLMFRPHNKAANRHFILVLLCLILVSLMFTRSTSFLLIAPLLVGFVVFRTNRLSLNSALTTVFIVILATAVLSYFLSIFYADRLLTSSAERSAAMRLASILGGLSPLTSGEIFGVGLGNNELVRGRAFNAARALGLVHGRLPDGINSLVVGRIFEEGWPAVLQQCFAIILLARAAVLRRLSGGEAALITLALGSFLVSLFVTGYRGIYTNWMWLAIAPAILANHKHQLLQNRQTLLWAAH